MRGFRSTLILFAVLMGLLGYIYFYEMKRPKPNEQVEQKEKVFTLQPDKVEEIQVRATAGDRTVLKKVGGAWTIVEPIQAKADETEATGLVTNLASLEIQRVVDEKPRDIAQYGLATPRADVAFRTSGQADLTHVLIGDKTATGGELYAKLPSQSRVFLISAFLDTTFNRTTFDLRDKTILKIDREKVDLVSVRSAGATLGFSKSGDRWAVTSPIAARADVATVEGLVGRLQTLQMKSIVGENVGPKDLDKYCLDTPAYVATVGAGSARSELAVGKADETGNLYVRDAARPAVVMTIEPSIVDDLRKKADDYRPKDVFEFKSFTATRLDVTRGTSSLVFERVTNKNGTSTWRRVTPSKDVAQAEMDAALGAISTLGVESYVDAKTKTGADAPVAVILARFDDGKKEERVAFGRVGADLYAVRAGEPGAAKVDAARFDEAMKALDAVK
ncbi:MAG: DUF4340 domain-containing protein [Acidobacteria bacterium]|nr:DUF4340 domain-containing protein [Acidobacteriota bacterium]